MKTNSTPYSTFFTSLSFLAFGLTFLSGQQFKSIFNGKDLGGWMGKEQFWKVEKGAIIGETTKEISDQYGSSVFTTTDGTQLNGRIMNMRNNEYWVNTDMMKPSTVSKVQAELITSIEPSPISMMPPGLINTMKKEDILDLLAYLISGGDRKHEFFDR